MLAGALPPPQGNVTFLFTDLVKSSQISKTLPYSDYYGKLLAPQFTEFSRLIAQYHGYESGTPAGDSVMAAFARVNDAIDCAIAMQRCLLEIGYTDPNGRRWRLEARIGIHRAVTDVDPMDRGLYLSHPEVNYAARVMGIAHEGQIVLSESARIATGVRAEPFKTYINRFLKDSDSGQTVHELLYDYPRERPEPGAQFAPFVDGFHDEIVNFRDRTAEMANLIAKLADPQVKFLCVYGPEGFGKSWMMWRLLQQVSENGLGVSSSPGGRPVRGILYIDCRDGLTVDQLMERFENFLRNTGRANQISLLQNARKLDAERHAAGSSSGAVKETAEALFQIFQEGQCLVLLNDLQGALSPADGCLVDAALEDFAVRCMRRAGHSLRLLATSRHQPHFRIHDPNLPAHYHLEPLTAGLPQEDVIALIRTYDANNAAGLAGLPDHRLAVIAQETHGWPLVIGLVVGLLKNPELRRRFEQDPVAFLRTTDPFVSSFQILTDAQRKTLVALSIYNEAVDAEAVSYLVEPFWKVADVEGCLAALEFGGWLQPNAFGRYRLLETIDDFVYNRVRDYAEVSYSDLHARAVAYYNRLRKLKEDKVEGKSEFERWYLYEDVEWQDAVRDWLFHLAFTEDKAQSRLEFARIFFDAFFWWEMYAESEFCRRLLDRWGETQGLVGRKRAIKVYPEDQRLLKLLRDFHKAYATGWEDRERGDWATVLKTMQEYRKLSGVDRPLNRLSAEQRHLRANTNQFAAEAHRYLGDAAAAESLFRESIRIYRADKNSYSASWATYNLADMFAGLGSLEQAEDEIKRTWALMRAETTSCVRAAAKCVKEGSEQLALGEFPDFELTANLFRIEADIAWQRGERPLALTTYMRAILFALLEQAFPPPPDRYTQTHFREMVSHPLVRAHSLQAAGDGGAAGALETMWEFWRPYRELISVDYSLDESNIPPSVPESDDRAGWLAIAAQLFPPGPADSDIEVKESDYIHLVRRIAIVYASHIAAMKRS